MVAVAFGGGILLSAIVGGRRQYYREHVSAYGTDFSAQRPRREPRRNEVGDKVGKIAGALMGVAADRALRFLAELIPGFSQNYDRMHGPASTRSHADETGTIH